MAIRCPVSKGFADWRISAIGAGLCAPADFLHFLQFLSGPARVDPMAIFRGFFDFSHFLHFLPTPSLEWTPKVRQVKPGQFLERRGTDEATEGSLHGDQATSGGACSGW